MAKIGRNAPCPCGSGKKYKKCCLSKDEAKRLEARKRDEEIIENKIPDKIDVDEDNFDDRDEFGYDTYDAMESNILPSRMLEDDVPELEKAEQALVDAWWETYLKLKNPDKIRQHIDRFLAEHPQLVPNLELHEEVIFDLGDHYIHEGRHAEYIELLERMRNEFTDVYQKSFGFYDRDMIAYQLLNGRKDKIRDYLNLFRKYPDDDPDNLFKVIELLMANNCQEILAEFVFDIYVKVCTSPDILGGEEILDQVVWSHFIPYLKPDFTADDMRQLATQLKTIEIPIDDKYCQHEFLQKKFKFIFGDFTNWQINDCKKKHAIYERYDETTLNFMGFLHTRKNKDWMAAEFLRRMVFSYLVECIPKGKRPKEAFEFTKQKIDEKIAKICQDLFFLDTVKTFGTLNGIYYFAEYLEETQTIGVEEKDQIQNWCSELFNQVYSHMVKQSFAAKVFEKFPF